MNKLSEREFETKIIRMYLDDVERINSMHGCSMHWVMETEIIQKQMYKRYYMTRPEFLKAFKTFYQNQPKPRSNEIYTVTIHGGTCKDFKKRNWVEVEGRHYILFHIDVEKYLEMRARGD